MLSLCHGKLLRPKVFFVLGRQGLLCDPANFPRILWLHIARLANTALLKEIVRLNLHDQVVDRHVVPVHGHLLLVAAGGGHSRRGAGGGSAAVVARDRPHLLLRNNRRRLLLLTLLLLLRVLLLPLLLLDVLIVLPVLRLLSVVQPSIVLLLLLRVLLVMMMLLLLVLLLMIVSIGQLGQVETARVILSPRRDLSKKGCRWSRLPITAPFLAWVPRRRPASLLTGVGRPGAFLAGIRRGEEVGVTVTHP